MARPGVQSAPGPAGKVNIIRREGMFRGSDPLRISGFGALAVGFGEDVSLYRPPGQKPSGRRACALALHVTYVPAGALRCPQFRPAKESRPDPRLKHRPAPEN